MNSNPVLAASAQLESQRAQPPYEAFLQDLKAFGVVEVPSAGLAYAQIKARSNERWWLLPLSKRTCAVAGLEMLQPVSLPARLAKAFARLVARYGPLSWLSRTKVQFSGQPGFCALFAEKNLSCAYFTGTDGPHRKTAVQIMDEHGNILGYAKISRIPAIQRYIENEARMLQELSTLALKTAAVPTLLSFTNDNGSVVLVTDSIKNTRHQTIKRLEALQINFLQELAEKTRQSGAETLVKRLADSQVSFGEQLSSDWMNRFSRGYQLICKAAHRLPTCLAHGDFTPWNSFVQDGSLYVFDWEYAEAAFPVGYDYVHFYLSTAQAADPSLVVNLLVKQLASEFFADDEFLAAHALLLSLLLHAEFYIRRAIAAGESAMDWGHAGFRGDLIDRVTKQLASGKHGC